MTESGFDQTRKVMIVRKKRSNLNELKLFRRSNDVKAQDYLKINYTVHYHSIGCSHVLCHCIRIFF